MMTNEHFEQCAGKSHKWSNRKSSLVTMSGRGLSLTNKNEFMLHASHYWQDKDILAAPSPPQQIVRLHLMAALLS